MPFNSFSFCNEVCTSLIGTLDTLATGNGCLNIWTNNTADLNKAWTEGPSDQTAAIKAINSQDSLNTYMGSIANLSDETQYCSVDMSLLLSQITSYADFSSGKPGSNDMSKVQQFSNLVGATTTIETATGGTETKAQASFQQQTTSAPQVQADIGNSAVGIMSTLASVLMQSFL